MDFLKNYLFFNPKYNKLNRNQLLLQYKKDKENKEIIKTINDFNDIYPDFDYEFYKNIYKNNKSNKECLINWINYGRYNNYIISEKDFYKKYKNFDYKYYKKENNIKLDGERNLIYHYLKIGIYDNLKICEMNDDKKKIKISNNEIKFKLKSNKISKVGHLFVHFFKCGGGENYLKNFIKYSYVENHLFLNKNYDNYVSGDININVIYYNDEKDLINKININNFDIILDHQYYLFGNLKLEENKIIHIIHSVINYTKKITNNYRLTINLYKEKEYEISWNNTIKVINYLGVNNIIEYKKIINKIENIIKNKKYILNKIAIIGRIDEHKFPTNFLELLISYVKYNEIEFNIYGNIDKNYKNYFLKKIIGKKNIKFHDYIEYTKINEIYLENDLLLSPSKSEAGGTVLLEAMNNGILILCRNKGGNKETLNNDKYLIEENKDYFDKINKIKEISYDKILNDLYLSKKKVLMNHNNKNNINNLCKIMNDYLYIENIINIPNIVHYIFGLKKQNEPFPFIYYYSILSNVLINKPFKIFFHYHYLPYGYWWNKIRMYLTLNYINYNELRFRGELVKHYAHKSDYIRLLMIYKYGGIYYDIDTLCVRPHYNLLENELVLGIQEKYKNEYNLIGNAIIMSKKENNFIKNVIIKYDEYFDNDKWTEASLFLPTRIYNNLKKDDKDKIKLLNKEYFYYPNYNEEYKIFNDKDEEIDEEMVTYHYCNNYLKRYLENIENVDYIIRNDNLYSKLMRNIYEIYCKNINKYEENNEIIKKEIEDIIIIIENNNYKSIERIIELNNLFFYNINIFIFIENDNEYKDENEIIEKIKYLKNINIYKIKLEEEINIRIKIDIIKYLIEEIILNEDIKIIIIKNKLDNDIKYIEEIVDEESNKINKDNEYNEDNYYIYEKKDIINKNNLKNLFLIKSIDY